LLLNPDHFMQLAEARCAEYREASPFPHIVIDDFLPIDAVEALLTEFDDAIAKREWEDRSHGNSKKLAITTEAELGERTRFIIGQMNGSGFIDFLEKLTGIDGLLPDPHLWGGGLHRIDPGGFLNIHADFNWHGRLKLDRRLNLLLYLNKDWPEEFGGELELWDNDVTRCERSILPIFNRCVIFNTTDYSMHGHPNPLKAPPGRSRKSLALYYYSNGRPEGETHRAYSKATDYKRTPQQRDEMGLLGKLEPFLPPVLVQRLRRK
jgi:Rps23 Pro-64 3,4-dihydroxylase Tpa1-like proline 4-hydroxylase